MTQSILNIKITKASIILSHAGKIYGYLTTTIGVPELKSRFRKRGIKTLLPLQGLHHELGR